MKHFITSILLLNCYLLHAQTQLGSDIDGEAADDGSGNSVSMNSAGDRVAIGANGNDGTDTNAGHVRVYEYSNSSWSQLGSDIDGEAAGDYSGASVSMNSAGDRVAIGGHANDGADTDAGHVRVYSIPITVQTTTYVPDDNFEQALIDLGYDDVLNDSVLTANISSITSLDITYLSISDLTGIEGFTALTELRCFNNQLTSLDVSSNTALTKLSCHENELTSLDVSNHTALTELHCSNNQLTSLDVSSNTALTKLSCGGNELTSLDVSNNTALTVLFCNSNELTSLDVNSNTALWSLNCGGNELTSLDVSNNTGLGYLSCGWNELTSLDVSSNTALTSLSCCANALTALDVSNNTALTNLACYQNQITALDVSANTALTLLSCSQNQLDSLDVSANTALTHLYCGYNQITSLDVSSNTVLGGLFCSWNQITSLDVSINTALTQLYCNGNGLTDLDVSSNTVLEGMLCANNELTSLDVSNNTALENLQCYNNPLDSLDVSNNTVLEILHCYGNQLTSLDVTSNTALTQLNCNSNQLSVLDLSYNPVVNNINTTNNDSLSCIYVLDIEYAQANWTINIDEWTSLCQGTTFSGPIWHVSTVGSDSPGGGSQDNPFATIQHAIASVDTGDTIIVHPGTYVENVDFGGKSIVLGSNWLFGNDTTAVDSTIIDGNHSGPVVTISNGEDSTTALIGFTLKNGSGAAIGNYNKGGGIYIEGSRPSIRWVNIEDCAADGGWGGGVYISDSDVSLIRTNISRNHAQWGGGISAENSHLILRFTTLIDDSASVSGGGVYLNNVDLNARRFNGFNNVAALNGGGLFATGGSDVVIRILMLNGNRANLGGALCFSDSSTIQLNNGNINLNNAENGGGIWASAVTGTIGAVRFQNNTAEDLGGAMHLSSNSDLEATDMVVINNSANRGGGVSILNSVADFVGGEINNNNAWRGGGIFSSRSDLDFFSITVTQNNSEDIGGGLLSISTNLVMDSTNVTFNSSDSSSGGGIRCLNFDSTSTYDVVITNSFISRNNAYNSGSGAFFSTASDDSSGMDILIENTRIIRNDGDYYAGLRIYGLNTQFEVNNCIFRGNNAVQYVGAAGFSGSCVGSVNHSLFAFNHAAIGGGNFNSGGASVWSGADVDFDHCTFANNTAAYGTALTVGAATAAVTNSIIWGNPTSNHVALDVWAGTGGTLDISYTDLIGGSQAIQLEDTELCSFTWGDGNINEAPLFCVPDSGNFTLAENSPCVAAADNGSNLGMFGIGCDPIILSTIGELLPAVYALHQNYPNPFNPVTTIKYDLPENSQVRIAIYDMLGRKVRTLVSGFENAGFNAVQWQGKNDFGRSVGAGVYICQIQAGDFVQTRKMILLK